MIGNLRVKKVENERTFEFTYLPLADATCDELTNILEEMIEVLREQQTWVTVDTRVTLIADNGLPEDSPKFKRWVMKSRKPHYEERTSKKCTIEGESRDIKHICVTKCYGPEVEIANLRLEWEEDDDKPRIILENAYKMNQNAVRALILALRDRGLYGEWQNAAIKWYLDATGQKLMKASW